MAEQETTALERALRSLTAEVEWPTAPPLALPAGVRQVAARRPARRSLAAAVALAAAAIALAVPGARSAILHFFRIGGVSVERVRTLPPAEERPLAAALGRPVGDGEAAQALGARFRLPRTTGRPQLYLSGTVVSALVDTRAGPVLISELRSLPAGVVVKKAVTSSTRVEPVSVTSRTHGYWLAGARHVVIGPAAAPRLAGDVLLFEERGITYRLEGAKLRLELALELARDLEP